VAPRHDVGALLDGRSPAQAPTMNGYFCQARQAAFHVNWCLCHELCHKAGLPQSGAAPDSILPSLPT
jgi:hypothetical protein